MIGFLLGVILGACAVVVAIFLYLIEPWSEKRPPPPFIDQFRPVVIPEQLRAFLKSGDDGQGVSKWESCHSLSLLFHMLFQEKKDSRMLRRWVHKRLQLEMNDVITRSPAGRLITEIKIRDLSLGNKFPSINAIRVESVDVGDDKNTFDTMVFVLDVDYCGGFETSIDVTSILGKNANLSIKITKLSGLVRVILSRKPYNYWTFSFVSTPTFDMEVASQIEGHQLRRMIPLIKESIRRTLQRKHVWPNYKIRYRPFFPNPLFQPSPPLNAFAHIRVVGGLEVTVLQCSRLKTALLEEYGNCENLEIYCTVAIDQRPFLQSTESNISHSMAIMLVYNRYDPNSDIGLVFDKFSTKAVRVLTVEDGSPADRAGFKSGDVLLAVNNVPIRGERQVVKFLQQTNGEQLVLVERNLEDIDDDEIKEQLIGDVNSRNPDDVYVMLGSAKEDSPDTVMEGGSATASSSVRRHSMSNDFNRESTCTDSMRSSLYSIDWQLDENAPCATGVARTSSARVPSVILTEGSSDLRRTRSESQLLTRSAEKIAEEEEGVSNTPRRDNESDDGVRMKKAKDPDGTLTAEDAKGGLTAGTLDPSAGSTASLQSMASSSRTDATTDEDGEGPLSRDRPQQSSSRRQRIQATLQAGKQKVLGMMPQKKRELASEAVEVGAEANENCESNPDEANSENGRTSPIETVVVDKKEKKRSKRSRDAAKISNALDTSNTSQQSQQQVRFRSTKPVLYSSERSTILWGQSLHFALEPNTPSPSPAKSALRYLNVTVHARERQADRRSVGSCESSVIGAKAETDSRKPLLLGFVSLYIPQLIDDCRLTLSNCHRELFTLRAPTLLQTVNAPSNNPTEFSRHAGYDPRICFGDVTLGFRYFPEGLPEGAGETSCENSNEGASSTNVSESYECRPMSPPTMAPSTHEWKSWSGKSAVSMTCSMCRGKIWLKSASRCVTCLVVCHNKCVGKANTGIACNPHSTSETDQHFEILDDRPSDLDTAMLLEGSDSSVPESVIPSTPPTLASGSVEAVGSGSVSRRTRLKNKMSERFSSWKISGRKKEKGDSQPESTDTQTAGTSHNSNYSPTSEASSSMASSLKKSSSTSSTSPIASIQNCLADLLPTLEGSPFISALYFEPGNAYNEDTISNAKLLGKRIFAEFEGEERQRRINEQIDKIQSAIRTTKDSRLIAMREGQEGEKFNGLDERLQALAVIMLHYCSALQDCDSTMSGVVDTLSHEQTIAMNESPEEEETLVGE